MCSMWELKPWGYETAQYAVLTDLREQMSVVWVAITVEFSWMFVDCDEDMMVKSLLCEIVWRSCCYIVHHVAHTGVSLPRIG